MCWHLWRKAKHYTPPFITVVSTNDQGVFKGRWWVEIAEKVIPEHRNPNFYGWTCSRMFVSLCSHMHLLLSLNWILKKTTKTNEQVEVEISQWTLILTDPFNSVKYLVNKQKHLIYFSKKRQVWEYKQTKKNTWQIF